MKIMVTGATSFIGSNVVKQLSINKGNIIYAVIRPNSVNWMNLPEADNVKVIELDMLKIEELHKYIEEEINVCYHFAWEGTRMPGRNDNIIQNQNYEVAKKVIDECHKLGCKRFIGVGAQA